MVKDVIYLDNHATTRVDPRVVEAMLPFFTERYGNAGSTSHAFGWEAREADDAARAVIARAVNASESEIVFTSGATESNNLALRGVTERLKRRGSHVVSVVTEHKSILDPLARLARRDHEVTLLPVRQHGEALAGRIEPEQVAAALRDDTVLVSVMLANNEIGVIQAIAEIGALCRERGVWFHCDATQAVGKMAVDVEQLNIDLMSFTAHKLYGPKGIGALYVRRHGENAVRLAAQIDGGGQENGLRSGTLNVPGIVGFAKALELCLTEMADEGPRLAALRDRLFQSLSAALEGVSLHGPALGDAATRLPGNLNCGFALVDGEALMMNMGRVAVSSGSACTSANPEPSHVLRALGLSLDATRASLRFGLGRFNTEADVEAAAQHIFESVTRLRKLSSMNVG